MTTIATKPNFKYEKSENEFMVYSNHTGVGITNFDLTLMFGKIDVKIEHIEPISGGTQGVTITTLGSVTMSPAHAKLVCANLQANIEQYEKMFGKINMTP